MGCIFCSIVSGQIPANILYETDLVVAFRDVSPKAPEHVLIIPKAHIPSIVSFSSEDTLVVSELFEAVRQVATSLGVRDKGFRLVANTGVDGGQTVDHFHFHLLAGRYMTWPPG